MEREYAVRVLGKVTDEQLARYKKGVRLEDGMGKFDEIPKRAARAPTTGIT